MKVKKINQREPTKVKVPDKTKASDIQKKKLYRQRTVEEVQKSLHFMENVYDDGDEDNQDPAHQTVDKVVDTARTAGDIAKDRAQSYSNKLKNRSSNADSKRSDALRNTEKNPDAAPSSKLKGEVTKAEKTKSSALKTESVKAEATKTEALKNEAEASKSAGKSIQKKRIKKQYAKAAREAKNAASSGKAAGTAGKKTAEKGADAVSAIMEQIGKFISEHPGGCAIAALILLVVLVVVSCIGSIGVLFGGSGNGNMASLAFSAKEADLKSVENTYKGKESALQTQINNIPSTYSGYDEYRYDLATIEHDPYELAAYLTTKYDAYEPRDVSGELTSLFNSQYSLTTNQVVETRYRWEPRTGYTYEYIYDEDGVCIDVLVTPYTYYVQVAYSYYILEVKLTNTSIDSIVRPDFEYDELVRYEALLATKGGYPDLWP